MSTSENAGTTMGVMAAPEMTCTGSAMAVATGASLAPLMLMVSVVTEDWPSASDTW